MLHRILSKIINRPLLITPSQAEIIYSIVAAHDGRMEQMLTQWEQPKPSASRFLTTFERDEESGFPMAYHGRTAVISVVGELVNRGAWLGSNSGLVSYEGVGAQLHAAANSKKADRILLDIESPGGEAVGAFELAELVRKIAQTKPVYGIANGMAASAAYAMLSGATRAYSTPSGLTGSIGVVMLHVDQSVALEKRGIKPTLIHAGAHKVDGNPFEPLSEEVHSDLQAEVNKFYEMFVATVEAGRGSRMRAEAIRSTEARMYQGDDAKEAGLVDAVMSFEDVLGDITRATVRPIQRTEGGLAAMSNNEGGSAAQTAGTFTQADVNAARAAGIEEGRNAALAAVRAITESEEARGRESSALALALSGISLDAAKGVLKGIPTAPPISERAAASGVDEIDSGASGQGPKPSGLVSAATRMYGKHQQR